MPRYFFHLYDDEVAFDPEGREFESLGVAKQQAIHDARALACTEVLEGRLGLNHRIELTDANDTPLATVRFKDAVTIHA